MEPKHLRRNIMECPNTIIIIISTETMHITIVNRKNTVTINSESSW